MGQRHPSVADVQNFLALNQIPSHPFIFTFSKRIYTCKKITAPHEPVNHTIALLQELKLRHLMVFGVSSVDPA